MKRNLKDYLKLRRVLGLFYGAEAFNLESAVESRQSARALDALSEFEKRLITQQVGMLF